MKRINEQFDRFLERKNLFVEAAPKRSGIVFFLMISVAIQSVVAAVPALVGSLPRNAGFYLGLIMIISVSIVLRTVASASLIMITVRTSRGAERRSTFRGMMVTSLYCQLILLTGKAAAVCVSLVQHSAGLTEHFSVIRFIDLSLISEMLGWTVPEPIGRADIFTVVFIAALTRIHRSWGDVPFSIAVVASTANWLIIGAVQRSVLELPKMIWS